MSDSNDLVGSHELQWNGNIEQMLSRWCDQAKCYEWMHTESYIEYEGKAKKLLILITIFGSFGGLSNVIAGDNEYNGFHLSWLFGSIGILIGMLNVLQDKLAYQSCSNDFKSYSIDWGVIRRTIEEELMLPPSSRVNCATFLKLVRKMINRVSMEGSAKIPDNIKKKCYDNFNHIEDFDIPDICGQIEHTVVYTEDLAPTGSVLHLAINTPPANKKQSVREREREKTPLLIN